MRRFKKGQILLITVMTLATVLTLILAVSFQSINETKISKLEEENQKALAAAEAAIEAALKENANVVIGQGSLAGITGFTGQAEIENLQTNIFQTGKVEKDSQYTFYLTDYTNNVLGTSSLAQDIEVCFADSSNDPAVEVTLIKTNEVKRFVYDKDTTRIANASLSSNNCLASNQFYRSFTLTSTDIGANSQLLIVRPLFSASKFLFKRQSPFPLQGKTVRSQAVSQTGVSKKITLFQTLPQIPAEFFYTSF